VQVGQQRGHLNVVEAAFEGGHHALSIEHDAAYLGIVDGCATGQSRSIEHAMKIGRNLLQCEIVVFMAMSAAHLVEMLPFHLLRAQLGSATASDAGYTYRGEHEGAEKCLEC